MLVFHGDLYHGELRANIFFFHIFQSVGPYIVDKTKPKFYGRQIDVQQVNNYLTANWSANAFQDSDDPYPMKFQFAVGWYIISILNCLYFIFIHICMSMRVQHRFNKTNVRNTHGHNHNIKHYH